MTEVPLPTTSTASEAQYRPVSAADILFDPENPRLGGVGKGKGQLQIQKHLEGAPHYALDLVGSMIENGFLPYEPLIVRESDGKFVVIEGNRRLAAVQSILGSDDQKYSPAVKERFRTIPVVVFAGSPGQSDSEEVLRYLGVKHLFGFRDWPPFSKAMFLDKRVSSKKNLDQVLNELNITKQEAARYLIPYRLTKVAKEIFKQVDSEDFWSLAESFGRKGIKAYIHLDVDRRTMKIKGFETGKLRHLAQFLYGKNRRVTDTRQLSLLSKVLSSATAASKLERGATLDEASLYVESKGETVSHLQQQLEKLLQKIKILSPNEEDSARILAILEEFSRRLKK